MGCEEMGGERRWGERGHRWDGLASVDIAAEQREVGRAQQRGRGEAVVVAGTPRQQLERREVGAREDEHQL